MNGELLHLNLGELLTSEVPMKISELEQSSVELERVAAYCEANYSQVLIYMKFHFFSIKSFC